MKYVYLPNPKYIVSKSKIYKITNNEIKELIKDNNGLFTIESYGLMITKPFKWFYNMAKHKISLPYTCFNRIGDIEFRPYGKRYGVETSINVSAKEPIIVNKKFALPLNYPGIAVSENGVVIDSTTYEVIKKPMSFYNSRYEYYYVYGRKFLVHRAILEAWVWNTDPSKYYIGNHKDGNKLNNTKSNLEWESHSGNIIHAFRTGLREDNIFCRTRNRDTGKITEHYSLSTMSRYLNKPVYSVAVISKYPIGHLINNHEIRLKDDNRDWYYTKDSKDVVGKVTDRSPWQVLELKNRKIRTFDTLTKLSEGIGLDRSIVNLATTYGMSYSIHGFSFRRYSEEPWVKFIKPRDKIVFKIKITDTETGKSNVYSSARLAGKTLEVNPKTLVKHSKKKSLLNNKYKIEIINRPTNK